MDYIEELTVPNMKSIKEWKKNEDRNQSLMLKGDTHRREEKKNLC